MRPHDGPQHIQAVFHSIGPFPHTGVHSIFQGPGAAGDRMHPGAQQFHAVHVQRLTDSVFLSHINLTFHVQQGGGGGSGHAVLPCAGLGNEAGLSHLFSQQGLAQHIVDLVRAGMVQILSLEIDSGPSQIPSHLLRIIQKRRSACVFVQQGLQFLLKFRVFLIMLITLLQMNQLIHQNLRHILSSVDAVTPFAHFSTSHFLIQHAKKPPLTEITSVKDG